MQCTQLTQQTNKCNNQTNKCNNQTKNAEKPFTNEQDIFLLVLGFLPTSACHVFLLGGTSSLPVPKKQTKIKQTKTNE